MLRAPLVGMVAHQSVYRGNSMGPPQEGDQLYPGYPLIRIFDPSEMEVVALVGEPDGAALVPGARADVYLDAYPELRFQALFESVESGGRPPALTAPSRLSWRASGSMANDPHLLPDLSAAVVIQPGGGKP